MDRSNDIAISVSNVNKTFKLPREKHNSIKSLFVNIFRRKKTYEEQRVLKDISFEIKKGEFFGIVGRNGSGKSTLLKLLSGIYTPDKGHIEVNGKLVPFIELGVGFNPELTGRENVFLNGSLLGFNRKEIEKMYGEIVEFAELERFMDQKLKNYSSGMQVRLAFSIAIRAKADILVLDEVLAVGDEAFQRKCNDFFRKIKKDKSKTIVLVTHSMETVREYCTRALLLNNGVIEVNSSKVDMIADSYSRLFIKETKTSHNKEGRFGSGEITIEKVKQKTTKQNIFIEFDIINKTDKTYENVFVGINVRHDGQLVTGNHMSHTKNYKNGLTIEGNERLHVVLELENLLTKHDYTIDLSVRADGGLINFDTINNAATITLADPSGSKFYKTLIPMNVKFNIKS